MATILDAFTKEDRVEVTFSDFYRLMRESTKSELIMNAVNCDVPHMYIREMATGNSEAECGRKNCDCERQGHLYAIGGYNHPSCRRHKHGI